MGGAVGVPMGDSGGIMPVGAATNCRISNLAERVQGRVVTILLRSFPQGPAPKPAARLTSGAATGGDGECWVGISLSPHRAPQGRGPRPRTATAACSPAAASVVARSHGGVRSDMDPGLALGDRPQATPGGAPCSAPVRAIPSPHAYDRRSAAPGRGPQRRVPGPHRTRTRPGGLGADLRR
jgi:hypothetical protein